MRKRLLVAYAEVSVATASTTTDNYQQLTTTTTRAEVTQTEDTPYTVFCTSLQAFSLFFGLYHTHTT